MTQQKKKEIPEASIDQDRKKIFTLKK